MNEVAFLKINLFKCEGWRDTKTFFNFLSLLGLLLTGFIVSFVRSSLHSEHSKTWTLLWKTKYIVNSLETFLDERGCLLSLYEPEKRLLSVIKYNVRIIFEATGRHWLNLISILFVNSLQNHNNLRLLVVFFCCIFSFAIIFVGHLTYFFQKLTLNSTKLSNSYCFYVCRIEWKNQKLCSKQLSHIRGFSIRQ